MQKGNIFVAYRNDENNSEVFFLYCYPSIGNCTKYPLPSPIKWIVDWANAPFMMSVMVMS
jgi:hypothetical protein